MASAICYYIPLRALSVQILLRIARLASIESYLVVIFPNSHEKLTNIEIRLGWNRFKHCSESFVQPIGIKSYLVIICPS